MCTGTAPSLKVAPAQLLTHKIPLRQPIGHSANRHRIRRRQPLYLRCNVGRLPQGEPFAPSLTSHLTDND